MILPLSALWFAAHRVFLRLGFRSRLLNTGAHDVHLYDRVGQGSAPPILLVHGMGGNAAGFLPIVRALLKVSKRVLAVELPGHGRAQLTPEQTPATLIESARAVGAALSEIGEPAVLVGSSLGGAISLSLAAEMPDRVAAIVGLNPAGAPLAGADRESVLQAFRGGTVEAAMAMHRRLYQQPPRLGWLFARDLARHWASPPVQHFLRELQDDLPGLPLEAIQQPVLILWGEADQILPASSVDYFRKRFTVEFVPGSGHLPMMEQARAVASRIVRFVREEVHVPAR